MKVKMILPALIEARSPLFRPIKYSLFPPLGLATLAGSLDPSDDVEIQDEHVERLHLDDDPGAAGFPRAATAGIGVGRYDLADGGRAPVGKNQETKRKDRVFTGLSREKKKGSCLSWWELSTRGRRNRCRWNVRRRSGDDRGGRV